jgi:hypothetical protein
MRVQKTGLRLREIRKALESTHSEGSDVGCELTGFAAWQNHATLLPPPHLPSTIIFKNAGQTTDFGTFKKGTGARKPPKKFMPGNKSIVQQKWRGIEQNHDDFQVLQ